MLLLQALRQANTALSRRPREHKRCRKRALLLQAGEPPQASAAASANGGANAACGCCCCCCCCCCYSSCCCKRVDSCRHAPGLRHTSPFSGRENTTKIEGDHDVVVAALLHSECRGAQDKSHVAPLLVLAAAYCSFCCCVLLLLPLLLLLLLCCLHVLLRQADIYYNEASERSEPFCTWFLTKEKKASS